MENEKKVVKLAEEKLGQVAGGYGDTPYTDCIYYRDLLRSKNNDPEDLFRKHLESTWNDYCGSNKELFSCDDCPVRNVWRFEYLR